MKIPGFRFAAAAAGFKKKGGLDVALLVGDDAYPAAAVFTRNIVRAAPVLVAEQRVLGGPLRALLVNAGNANACTGEAGLQAVYQTTNFVAQALACPVEQIASASTGVIGQVLQAELIEAQMPSLIAALSEEKATDLADAILTTDRFRKVESTQLTQGNQTAHFLGICKGAGMIHPDLGGAGKLPPAAGPLHATMLGFLLTDAKSSAEQLQRCLEQAMEQSFNQVSVDGDTSTNDTVFLLASGKSELELSDEELTQALLTLCRPLARSMVKDGEGAEHVVDLVVRGLPSDEEARQVARTIATSPLVKTALAGRDANWGRLLAAAGRSGVHFDASQAQIHIDGVCICQNGLLVSEEADRAASERMKKEDYSIEIVLGAGPGSWTYTTCDLGHAYIDINASYRS